MRVNGYHGPRPAEWNRERFMRYIVRNAYGCWLWGNGPTNRYATVSVAGRSRTAHRLSWELFRGEIPVGLLVCHTCDVPRCVNPDHLFVGDATANMQDAARKGRTLTGDRNSRRRLRNGVMLTMERAQQIRQRRFGGERGVDLAREFGVSVQMVCHIHKGRRWA